MSWLENAARWSLRVPRGALRSAGQRARQPVRMRSDEPDPRQPGPSRDRDVSPSKVRREAIICPPALQTTWPYQLPPQMPPPRRPPPPSRPPPLPPRPTSRLDFVRTLRVPARRGPPPPRSPGDKPEVKGLCPMQEATCCPRVPGPGGQAPPAKVDSCNPCEAPKACDAAATQQPPADVCCDASGQEEAERPQPLFSCEPPMEDQGPCPPQPPEEPCPPPTKPPALLRCVAQLFWWGGRAALAASVVYWTYVFGLWGSSDDTQAIVDKWRRAVGFSYQAGSGLLVGVSRVWDTGVKTVFSAVAHALHYVMGPGMGTQQPRHRTAEIVKEPEQVDEDDEDDELSPCGCCRRKPPDEGDLPG